MTTVKILILNIILQGRMTKSIRVICIEAWSALKIIYYINVFNHKHTADENLRETGGNTYLCTKLFIRDSHSSQIAKHKILRYRAKSNTELLKM